MELDRVDDTELDVEDLDDIYGDVERLASKWPDMCTALKLPPDRAGAISSTHQGDPWKCLKDVLHRWLKRDLIKKYEDRVPTWRILVEAIAKPSGGGDRAFAEKLAKKHPKQQDDPESTQQTAQNGADETSPGREVPNRPLAEDSGGEEEEPGEEPKYTDTGSIYFPKHVPTDPTKRAELASFAEKVVLILHTCNDKEFLAVVEMLKSPTGDDNQPLADRSICYQAAHCAVGMFAGCRTAVVKTGQGKHCITPLIEALERPYFPSAKVIIGVGIAYGKDRKQQRYADVIVSKQIEDCSQVKFKNGEILNRGDRVAVDRTVKQVFCTSALLSWGPFYCTLNDSRKSDVHCGCIMSAPWLISDQQLKEQLFKHTPEAKGGEMEGWALLEVKKTKPVEVIIIKGVSDYGDDKKGDDWQLTAAKAAVAFTHYHIERNGGEYWIKCKN